MNKHKLIQRILVIFTLVIINNTYAQVVQLVQNGGFENGDAGFPDDKAQLDKCDFWGSSGSSGDWYTTLSFTGSLQGPCPFPGTTTPDIDIIKDALPKKSTFFKCLLISALLVIPVEFFQATISHPIFPGFASATYARWFGCDHDNIQKPIIIIPGFDPLGTEDDVQSIYNTFNTWSLNQTLRAAGYDIITVDFSNPSTFIQLNGLVIVELIEQVNQQLQANGSDEEIVVIGMSMGRRWLKQLIKF